MSALASTDLSFAIELIKTIGFPALIFIIWVLYHRSETAKWENIFQQNRLDTEEKFHLLKQIFDQNERAREREFQLLKETTEMMHLHTGVLSRVEQKIDTNQFCPVTRRKSHES